MPLTTLPDRPKLREVRTLEQANEMRKVRNNVRGFMTHNTAPISFSKQFEWFMGTYLPRHEAGEMDAYLVEIRGHNAGYGIIQDIDGSKWVTGALMRLWRGKGHGEQLFTDLTNRIHDTDETAWLDVREDNTAARNLYEKIGYCETERACGLIVMKHEVQTC